MLGKPNLVFEIVLTNGVIKTGHGQQLKLQHQPPPALVNHNSGSFLRRQLSGQEIRQKISVIKTNSFDWELLTFDYIKKIVHLAL